MPAPTVRVLSVLAVLSSALVVQPALATTGSAATQSPPVAPAAATASATATAPAAATAAPAPSNASGTFSVSANYTKYNAALTGLQAALPNVHVHDVMDNANHDRTGLGSGVPSDVQGGFRFDSGDNSDCRSVPQGITTTRDSGGTANSGNYDGHQLVAVSWYTKVSCDAGAATRGSRLTLVDWDATYPNKYRKVLLVEPTGTQASPDFTDVPVHAGGVVWYGNYLYLADTSNGLRVFDMSKILETNTGGTDAQIGRQSNGTYYAHNYRYVLPQVGTITDTSSPQLNWSTISLDRVSKSLVVAEYTCNGCTNYPDRKPFAVRFPFASGSTAFAATTTASQALLLPYYNINGVASHNGRWWFNDSSGHRLYYWTTGATSASYFGWVSSGESISYWEDASKADLLWSLREGAGSRDVFTVPQAHYTS